MNFFSRGGGISKTKKSACQSVIQFRTCVFLNFFESQVFVNFFSGGGGRGSFS